MNERCSNPRASNFGYYGGREIAVCDEWARNFAIFRDWAMANGYRDDLTIERVDNDGNYAPDNCRWVSPTEQARNRRSNIRATHEGKTMTLVEWGDALGIAANTLRMRLRKGWSIERALITPARDCGKAGGASAR